MLSSQSNLKQAVSVVINQDKCTKCNKCNDACPLTRCFGFKSLEDEFIDKICIACGTCMAVCPQGAIIVNGLAPAIPAPEIPSSAEALNLIKRRRSVRAFKRQKVKSEDWEKLIEAVKYSPTGHNSQYIDLMIIETPETLAKITEIGIELFKKFSVRLQTPIISRVYKKMLGDHTALIFSQVAPFYEQQKRAFEQGADPILFHAPALLLFLAPGSELMGKNDADLAAQTVALYAPTLGLGTCYSGMVMAAFSGLHSAIKDVVKIPRGYKVHNALIVGYAKHKYAHIPPRRERNVYYL